MTPNGEEFRLQGADVLEAFLDAEPDPLVRRAVLDFILSLLADPKAFRGTGVPGSNVNEVSMILSDVDVALTWFVAWGERVVWLTHVEHLPRFP